MPDPALEYHFTLTEQDLVDAARLSARPMFRLVALLGGIVFALTGQAVEPPSGP